MIALIGQYKVETYASWTSRVDEDCKINLSQPLIIRNSDTNLISVNFDKRLQAVLREVKYLKFMNEETIPESAAQVRFSPKANFFKTLFSSLNATILSVFGYHPSIRSSVGITRFEQLFCLLNCHLLNNKWTRSMPN